MDKTEMYVRMCDCKDVQSNWKKEKGDWAFNEEENEVYAFTDSYLCGRDGYILVAKEYSCENEQSFGAIAGYPDIEDKDFIWLPTQDQIQGMIIGPPAASYSVEGLFVRFHVFWNDEKIREAIGLPQGYSTDHVFNSGEQLWLAFYMYEKHRKIWDGEKWNRQDDINV